MMYGYGYDYGIFHLINTVFWIACVIFIVGWARRNRAMRQGSGRWSMPWNDKGIEILKERYAKGEITKEEYEERKKVLMG